MEGRDQIFVLLTEAPLSVEDCLAAVSSVGVGGTTIFVGSVRNQTDGKRVLRLEFEAYEPMAKKEMEEIAREAIDKFGLEAIAIHHAIGILEPGALPVVIAASAAHRDAAFRACRYAIDRLKERVPIWKREVYEDGEVWVSAHP